MKTAILIALLLLFVSLPVNATTIVLGWDANTETDLAGYRLYRGATSITSGGYTNTPAYKIGDIPTGTQTYTWTNVPDGPHYFSLTAYDTANNESGFSNEVFTVAPEFPEPKNEDNVIILDVR